MPEIASIPVFTMVSHLKVPTFLTLQYWLADLKLLDSMSKKAVLTKSTIPILKKCTTELYFPFGASHLERLLNQKFLNKHRGDCLKYFKN